MKNINLTFDQESHTYFIDEKPVPSVTQLTSIYGTMDVYEDDLMELTYEAAAERGIIMHSYIEHRLDGGDAADFEIPDAYQPYADAVELFLSEHTIEPMLVETALCGEADGVAFAGTPDFVGEFDGVLSILDWKVVSQVQKTKVGAQLSGYLSLCFCNGIFPERLYCVQFLQDGTYRLYPVFTLSDTFYLCLSVHKEKTKKHPRGVIA